MVRHVRPSVVRSFFKVFLFFFVLFAIYEFLATNVYMTQKSKNEIDWSALEVARKIEYEQQFNKVVKKDPVESEPSQSRVIIMSSMPRSGSTLMGELLRTHSEDTIYYFEPDQYIERNGCILNNSCTVSFHENILLCNEDMQFFSWFKNKKFFFKYYNEDAKKCCKLESSDEYMICSGKINLISDCIKTSFQLIKNIRTRLRAIFKLMDNKNIDFKVIHLYRDPRGSLLSISRFGWGIPEVDRCQGLLDDLNVYDEIKEKYPNRITQITYESFCLDPWENTRKLFQFIFNNGTLPKKTVTFLNQNISPKEEILNPMSTAKNSKERFQSWRTKISEKNFRDYQGISECKESIVQMGHVLFDSIESVRNTNLTLFANEMNKFK